MQSTKITCGQRNEPSLFHRRGAASLLLLLAALLLLGGAARGKGGGVVLRPEDLPEPQITVKEVSDKISTYQRADVRAPLIGRRGELWRIIGDYEGYRELFGAVAESRIIEQTEKYTDVHMVIDLPWPIEDRWFDIRFERDEKRGRMVFHMLQGRARRLFGRASVAAQGNLLLLQYRINFTTRYRMPGWIVSWAVGSVFGRMVETTQERLVELSREPAKPAGSAEPAKKSPRRPASPSPSP